MPEISLRTQAVSLVATLLQLGQRLPDVMEIPVLLACELAGYQRASQQALEARYAPATKQPDTAFDVEAAFKEAWEGASA